MRRPIASETHDMLPNEPTYVTLLTPTYNKPQFLLEAGMSVIGQTYPHWQWWIVLDGADEATIEAALLLIARDPRIKIFPEATTTELRQQEYRPAVIMNEYYPKINTPYLAFLADDDLLDTRYLEHLVGALASRPHLDVVYGTCEVVIQNGVDRWDPLRMLYADVPIGYGTGILPCRRIDGGQILQTKRSYDALQGYQLPTSFDQCSFVDGIYMDELAAHFVFFPVPTRVMTKRCTHLSAHQRGVQ